MRWLLALPLAVLALAAIAGPRLPPQVGGTGLGEYGAYLEAPDHRAFAVAVGGAWGWSSGQPSAGQALEKALATCQAQSRQRCLPYAVDDRLVFDAGEWARSLGPYLNARQARQAAIGSRHGQRMIDLAYTDAGGRPARLAGLQGKVVVLHFWGAWCPPCRKEMPDLQALYGSLAGRPDIAFVVLQVREPYSISRQWAARQNIALPFADSGSTGEEDTTLRLAGGRRVSDRAIAGRFPTTYILDRNGIIVFSHVGPVHDWPAMAPVLIDVAARSGR